MITWGRWPVSGGRQFYVIQDWKKPVSSPTSSSSRCIRPPARFTTRRELTGSAAAPSTPRLCRAGARWRISISCCPDRAKPVDARRCADHLTGILPDFVDLITCENMHEQRHQPCRAWASISRCSRWTW